MSVTASYIFETYKEVEDLLFKGENQTVTYKGVSNVSKSDLAEIKMRLGTLLAGDGGLMEPVGVVEQVMTKISKGL